MRVAVALAFTDGVAGIVGAGCTSVGVFGAITVGFGIDVAVAVGICVGEGIVVGVSVIVAVSIGSSKDTVIGVLACVGVSVATIPVIENSKSTKLMIATRMVQYAILIEFFLTFIWPPAMHM